MMSEEAAISWRSKLQEVVGLSSMEAEDMALIHVAREGLYLQHLEVGMGVDDGGLGVLLLCAN